LDRGEDFDDTLAVLQHPPVYTLGTRSSEANLKFDADDPPFELHRTERGGEVGVLLVYLAVQPLRYIFKYCFYYYKNLLN
jgi:lipoyl(octanoyl) transferase